MKNIFGLFALLLIVFSSCRDDDREANLNLVFQANFGTDILELNKEYKMLDGKAFLISRSDFFLSDVRLVADNGTEVDLFDYIQVDFESSPGGVSFLAKDLPSQNYETLRFGLGLNEDLNKTEPIDYDLNDPLSNSGYYWSAWDSYIFSKTEGRVDEDGDGSITDGWIFHTGKDELFREVSISLDKEIEHNKNGADEIRITVDHKVLFESNGEAVDLGIIHDPTDLEVLGGFMDRIVSSFSYRD